MFAEKLDNLIHKYPQDADAYSRLAGYFSDVETKSGERYKLLKLEPDRLFDIAKAGSQSRLARVIAVLINEHVLTRLLIVNSPEGGGIATFNSYSDIPAVIHDNLRDVDFEVTVDSVRTVYIPVV
jgi:hypothetical protein